MFMDNIFPQVGRFNGSGGSWYYTEKVIECLREGTDLDIYLGLIMGDDDSDDYFIESHGVRTPDFAWKVVHRKDTGTLQAYVMPNSYDSTESRMDSYMLTVNSF
jgi:endonuclease G